MKQFLALWTLIMIVLPSTAQGTSPFPTVERCITVPAEPPDDWTFDGTIITFQQGDGIHGFRADTPNRYYIAFDNERSFTSGGSFSPDGKWFAYFVGRTRPIRFTSVFDSTHLRVISILPDRKSYTLPFVSVVSNAYAAYFPVYWITETQIVVSNDYSNHNPSAKWYLIEPFTGITELATQSEIDSRSDDPAYHFGVKPSKRNIFTNDTKTPRIYTLHISDPITRQVYDTCIETSNNFAVSSTDEQIAVSIGGDDGFVYVIDIPEWNAYRLNLAANLVIAWLGD